MHQHLRYLSLATATLLLSLAVPLSPLAFHLSPLKVRAQTERDQSVEADRLMREGLQQHRQKQFTEALKTFQQALAIYRKIGDRAGEGIILNNIGEVYRQLGVELFPKALESFQQALNIYKEIGDQVGIRTTLLQIENVQKLSEMMRLFTESDQQYRQGQFREALVAAQQSLTIIREMDDRSVEALQLNHIGNIYLGLDRYPQALESYQKALAIHQELGERDRIGLTLTNIGDIYLNLSQYNRALESYQKALTIVRAVGDRKGEGINLRGMGTAYSRLSQSKKALEYYQQALEIQRQMGDHQGEAATLTSIGSAYAGLSQYDQALEFFQQALKIDREVNSRSGEAANLSSIGAVYWHLGQYAKALEFYQQALTIRQEIGDRSGEGITLSNLGTIYLDLGQEVQALKFLEQALAIHREVGKRHVEGTTLNSMGALFERTGRYTQALEFYQKVLAIRKEVGDRTGEATTLNNVGGIYTSLAQYPKALESYQQALGISREASDYQGEGRILNNIGEVYSNLNQYSQAVASYQQALAVARKIGARQAEGISLSNLGETFLKAGNLGEATENLLASIEIWESVRLGLADTNKVSFFDTISATYGFLQQAFVAQNKTNTALEIAERGRARAFVELLASKVLEKPNSQLTIKPLTILQIQQVAREQKATLVPYSIVDDELYIWVVKPIGKVDFKQVDLRSQKILLEDLITSTRQSIGVRGRDSLDISFEPTSTQSDRLKQLYKLLIEPIAQYLPTDPNDRVIFIPQKELFLVPFPALQDASGKYLIQKHTILMAPSIQVLQLTREKRPTVSGDGVLVVGNPTMPSVTTTVGESSQQLKNLPGAQKEATDIAQLLNTKALTGKQATKAAVLPKLSNARIIHLATHGLLDDFKGLGVPGAIALAPDGTGELNDGLLTSNEIFGLKLNAELVVLSACDTGRGRVTGDGVIGLSRSLITAGVPSVIVSLWSVPDAPTASLMTEFYQNLQKNPNKAQALRQAMLTTMKQHPNPIDWAAFTLIGEAQ
jgi:CHAT domain-containing protein/predicted negative regulator of RcsB-dependent stress response